MSQSTWEPRKPATPPPPGRKWEGRQRHRHASASRDLARPGTSPQGAPRRVHRRRRQGWGPAANRCSAGPAPLGRWSTPRGSLSSWSAVLSTLARAAGGCTCRLGVRAPSGLSGHLVQTLRAGAHLSQPTSGEGDPQAPPPPPTPKPSPRAPTLVYLGGSIPGSAQGGGVTQRAIAHRVSCPGRAEDMSFVQVFFVG